MIIDAHCHPDFMDQSADDLLRNMDAQLVDRALLLTWEEATPRLSTDNHVSVAQVLAATQNHPDRFLASYAPDPRTTGAADLLREIADQLAACGELKTILPWSAPELTPLLDVASEFRLPVIFHMEAPVVRLPAGSLTQRILSRLSLAATRKKHTLPGYLSDFDGLAERLHQYPELPFVAHGPLFWQALSGNYTPNTDIFPQGPVVAGGITPKLLAQYPNLYADLSAQSGYNALARDTRFAKDFLVEFADKLLYGTDNMNIGLKDLLHSLHLPTSTMTNIMGGNAQNLFLGSDHIPLEHTS